MNIEQRGGQSFQPGQTGLSRLESFVIRAAESRWVRGVGVVLGLGAGGAMADYLIQPAFAQVEYLPEIPVSGLPGTPVPEGTPPVILTAEAIKHEARIRGAQIREQQTREAAMAEAEAVATAIVAQARQDNPEWAAEQDRQKSIANERILMLVGAVLVASGFLYLIVDYELNRNKV